MRIVIAGCGNVGYALAEQLNNEGNEITLIDTNAQRIKYVAETLDIQGLAGNGVSYGVLKEAGVSNADLYIAVTDEDEINMLGCLIATKAGAAKTIARVRNPLYYDDIQQIKDELGLSMYINPEREAAHEMSRLIQIPSAIDVDTFDKSRMNMIKFEIPSGSVLDGMMIKNVKSELNSSLLVCVVQREADILIPTGDFKLRSGDVLSVLTPVRNAYSVLKKAGLKARRIKDVMIAGGGKISYYLAQLLIKAKINVKIVEESTEQCEILSELLPEAIIICGNVTNQQLWLEEGIHNTDAFVSVTDTDEENIMLSLYAGKVSDAKVITKIKNVTFEEIVSDLNVGSVVEPKKIVSENIVSYVRALQNSFGSNIETLYKLNDDRVEAVEFVVSRNIDGLVGLRLMDIKLKSNIIVCSIKRGMRSFIPDGKDTIELGDRVIIVTTDLGLNDLKDIIEE